MRARTQDLIRLATSMYVDEASQQEGWEAFPTTKLAADSYALDLVQGRLAAAGGGGKGGASAPSAEQRGSGPHSGSSFGCGSPYAGAGPSAGLDTWPSAPALYDFPGGGSSAPWQHVPGARAGGSGGDVLSLEPPPWLPDSQASECLSCHMPFRPFTRLRHHCRLCGKIFCHSCCHKQALLPAKYNLRWAPAPGCVGALVACLGWDMGQVQHACTQATTAAAAPREPNIIRLCMAPSAKLPPPFVPPRCCADPYPVRSTRRTPQRVCELCSSALAPHQQHLASTQAAAAQAPVQDAADAISLRAWLNAPWTSSLEGDVFKAANMLTTFVRVSSCRCVGSPLVGRCATSL